MRYHNLELKVFDYSAAQNGSFKVLASSPLATDAFEADAETVATTDDLPARLRLLDQRRLTFAEQIKLGEQLAELLLPPGARRVFDLARGRLPAGDRLRLRLRLDAIELADIPWEYIYIPRPGTPADQKGAAGFLALDPQLSIVRDEQLRQPRAGLDPVGAGALRLVMLLANPEDAAYRTLNLEREQQTIATALANVPTIAPDYYPDATVEALEEALIDGAHIFHFAGHGDFKAESGAANKSQGGDGYLVLVDQQRRARLFSAERLAINLKDRGVRLAVLSACEGGRRDKLYAWSGVAPALVESGIPAVVAMQYSIVDDNAIAFSRMFYRTLAAGQSIDAAVSNGRRAIFNRSDENSDDRDWGVPVLYHRVDEGVLFPRPDPTASGNPGPAQGTINISGGTTYGAVVGSNTGTITNNFGMTQAPAGGATRPPDASEPSSSDQSIDKRALRKVIAKQYSLAALEILCDDLEHDLDSAGSPLTVNLDLLGGDRLENRALNLIDFLDRRGYLSYLVAAVRRDFPGSI